MLVEIGRPRSRRWNNFGRRWTRAVGGLENWTNFLDVICVSYLSHQLIFKSAPSLCRKGKVATGNLHYFFKMLNNYWLRKKCPFSKFFWSVFSRIWTENGDLLIQSKCEKIPTRKSPNRDTFHAVALIA